MTTAEKLQLIKENLSKLEALDKKCNLFGSSSHNYRLNDPLSDSVISAFEEKNSITLPEEYRSYIAEIGNGGVGPYYGLQTLENSLFSDLDYKRPGELVKPSEPFPFTEPWNMEFSGEEQDEAAYEKYEKEYFSEKWETGILRICNYGCGITLNLVVNGHEKGNIWVDDRGHGGGIYPDPYFGQKNRTTFLSWYNLWLDQSLSELENETNT
ncbi:MAG: SMI1/KNR4 family protein [Cellvibrionaceae bacterium]